MISDWLMEQFINFLTPLFTWLASLFPPEQALALDGLSPALAIPGYYIDVLPFLTLLGLAFAVFGFSVLFKVVLFIWRLLPLT